MAYFSQEALKDIGFKSLGKNVKISDKASIYNPEKIELGDFSRIDDFCVISGRVSIGKYVHVAPLGLIAGGEKGVFIGDFSGLSYGIKIFSQSDDYSGSSMVSSLIPKKFKNEYLAEVHLERHVIVGAGSIVFPGVTIKEGCSIGAMTLVNKSTLPWGIYVGTPARRVKDRKKGLLELEAKFLKEQKK